MKLGTAKNVITPEIPVRMCGYATRTGAFDGVVEDIYVRVHAYEEDGRRAVFCYADLIWFNNDVIPMFRKALRENGIDENSVVFFTSHNHSGPGTGRSFTALLETCDDAYREFLIGKVVETVRSAISNLEDVDLYYAASELDLVVNRRKMIDGAIAMVPNYEAPADRNITVIKALRKDGSVKGMLVHYACHANLSNENQIHGDYPGAALRMLDETYEGSVNVFLQGCTGDMRPNSTIGNVFCPATRERIIRFATIFKDKVVKMAEGGMRHLSDDVSVPYQLSFELPLDQEGVREKAENASSMDLATQQWAECVRAKDFRPYETMVLTRVVLGGIPMLFYNAEVVQSYAAKARDFDRNALSIGYSNGMIGYISNAKQIEEGGYEPCGSALYFSLAGTYKRDIERIIVDNIGKMFEEER